MGWGVSHRNAHMARKTGQCLGDNVCPRVPVSKQYTSVQSVQGTLFGPQNAYDILISPRCMS